MLIDTNGFEIGDEVYFIVNSFMSDKWTTIKSTIIEFTINKKDGDNQIMAKLINGSKFPIDKLSTKQEAIDYCNRLNGEK